MDEQRISLSVSRVTQHMSSKFSVVVQKSEFVVALTDADAVFTEE